MGVGRWRWLLVPMVVLVAACVPQPPELPAAFVDRYSQPGNPTFTVRRPPAGETGQDIVAALQANRPWTHDRVELVYGVMDCHGQKDCWPVSDGHYRGGARDVWVVTYPDCTGRVGLGPPGWVVVDAVGGPGAFNFMNLECPSR
jgi:hypothetical protein